MLLFFIGMLVGAFIATIFMALFNASSRYDEYDRENSGDNEWLDFIFILKYPINKKYKKAIKNRDSLKYGESRFFDGIILLNILGYT